MSALRYTFRLEALQSSLHHSLSPHPTLLSVYAGSRPPVRHYTILRQIQKHGNKCSAAQTEAGGTSHGTGLGNLSNAGSKLVDLADRVPSPHAFVLDESCLQTERSAGWCGTMWDDVGSPCHSRRATLSLMC